MSAALAPVDRLIAQEAIFHLTDEVIFDLYCPVVLSALFACLFQGYVFAMCVSYFRGYAHKDHWIVRCTMLAILFSTFVETVLVMIKSIRQTVIHPLDVIYVFQLYTRPDEYMVVAVANISITICQAYLCWRCVRFARAMQNAYAGWVRITMFVVGGLTALLLVLSLVGTVMLPIELSRSRDLLQALSTYPLTLWFYFTFGVFVGIDILIVVVTTTQHRAARTGFAESNTILDVIVNLSLRNGMVILLAQTAQLVLFHTATSTAWVLFPHSFLSRIYAITVFTTLILPRTAQSRLRQRQADQEEAMLNDNSAMPPPKARFSNDGRSLSPARNARPSSSYARCITCGSCTLTPNLTKSGKGGPTPRIGYRGSGTTRGSDGATLVTGFGELGVTINPGEKSEAEDEGPISFTAALFGTPDAGEQRAASPEIGVDGIGSRRRNIPGAQSIGMEDGDWLEKQVEGYQDPAYYGESGRRASREPGTGLGLPSVLFRSPSL